MVALTDDARARWEKDRERREVDELERYAALLLVLCSPDTRGLRD